VDVSSTNWLDKNNEVPWAALKVIFTVIAKQCNFNS
jgi:hypothetical protein